MEVAGISTAAASALVVVSSAQPTFSATGHASSGLRLEEDVMLQFDATHHLSELTASCRRLAAGVASFGEQLQVVIFFFLVFCLPGLFYSLFSYPSFLHPSCLAVRMLGLDQVGPLKKAKGGFKYIFVAIDKFTKWIEYKPLIKYSTAKAVEFIQDIMHRFGIPNHIITDLGSPFTAIEFRNWAQGCGISMDYASVARPEANG
jgi:hypothetical protein